MAEYAPIFPPVEDPRRTVPWRTDRKEWWMRLAYGLVILMGVLVWGRFFTDYSLIGSLADEIFGPAVGVLTFLLFLVLLTTGSAYARSPWWLAMLPAMIGGGLLLLWIVVMWIPPFTMGAAFYWDEVLHEQAIQTVVSPDGQRTATVYWRGVRAYDSVVGAYDSVSGRTSVQITRRGIPLVEREVYWNPQSYADESTSRYVRWQDDRTLVVIGEPEEAPATINLGGLPL